MTQTRKKPAGKRRNQAAQCRTQAPEPVLAPEEPGIQATLLLTDSRIKRLICKGLRLRKLTPRPDSILFFESADGPAALVEIIAPRRKAGKPLYHFADFCALLTEALATEGYKVRTGGISLGYKPHPDCMFGDGLTGEVILREVPDTYPEKED
jgi:hypothetical protein